MAYPSLEQYNQAFQLHSRLLQDPELRSGAVATSGMGLPLAISGGFALTYTIKTGASKYAVRCFHRESKALERRYEAIAKKLSSLRSPYFLDFQFQPQGIRVDGVPYPIIKMAWASGETLGEFLENNKSSPQALSRLSTSLESIAAFLANEGIAHGDVQTGNLMVSAGGATVQLIDYDGMYVDEIKSLGSSELGHVNFQHPKRKASNPFDPTLDRFSLISLWLALKALRIDSSIWSRTNSEVDAIVFRANDFTDPGASAVFAVLANQPAISNDVKNFAAICASEIATVPTLADFIAGRNIPSPATAIRLTGSIQPGRATPGYIGAYDILSALDYDSCLRRVGDKVEVIGQIIDVKLDKARNGKPYIFVNFGHWRGRIFKISIWSEGLDALRVKPDSSWIGKWISVTGLMEPPYISKKYNYSHLSITVSTTGQLIILSEADAKWRLAGSTGGRLVSASNERNKQILGDIKGQPASITAPASRASPLTTNQAVLANIQASTQASARPKTSPNRSAPAASQASSYAPPPKQQEKGVIAKLFSWLFG